METPAYIDIQRRHVEESKRWPDLRAYAAEVLRRQKAKQATKSRRGPASQRKSVPRKTVNAKQQARRTISKNSAPLNKNKKIQHVALVSNGPACRQLEQTILQQNTTDHAIPVSDTFPDMQAPSHVPSMTVPHANSDSNPYASREDDGKGMNEASFQKLLADIRTGLQTIPEPNDASVTNRPTDGSRQRTQMVNTSPETVEGCVLCFIWRYSHCHHFNTVHKDVVPIWQNNASAVGTTNTAIQTPYAGSGQNAGPFLRLHADTSSTQNSGLQAPGVSKKGRILNARDRRQGKGRKNPPAVVARQHAVQLSAAALTKSSSQATAKRAPGKLVRARSRTTPQVNSVPPTCYNAPEAVMGFIDTSHFDIPDVALSTPPGSSDIADSLFEEMDVMFSDHLSLPMLGDLPSPEDFFYGT